MLGLLEFFVDELREVVEDSGLGPPSFEFIISKCGCIATCTRLPRQHDQ